MAQPSRTPQAEGPALAAARAVMLALPEPANMSAQAWATAAVAVLMASWWASEALPVAVTALLPLILFPTLGLSTIDEAAVPYANPLIFLFLGGFLIALAMQRANLHRRLALALIARVGTRPEATIAGFMGATAFLSMWVSNTATTMMMLPIALSVAGVVGSGGNFVVALLLGVAYAANIGGLGTLIGTPPNAWLAAYMAASHGVEIGFAEWMVLGVPLVVVFLPLAWVGLVRLYPIDATGGVGGEGAIAAERAAMGPMSPAEKRVAAIFVAVAALWVGRPWLAGLPGLGGLSDTGIALAGGLATFVVPAGRGRGRLMDWAGARALPWEVLLLFGGGLSLAAQITRSGLADWLGAFLAGFGAWPLVALIAAVAALILFLTELTSNTATTAAFLPVVAALAGAAGHPVLALAAPAAIAASCAFMLPVATPPNAIVFGSGKVRIGQMVRAGIVLNLSGIVIVIVTVLVYLLAPLL